MPKPPTTITDELGIALANLADAAGAPFTPTLRLGVTGLSRAGKTVFITALVHALLAGGRLPGLSALTEGRFIGARLAESPDAGIPRFAYEQHLKSLEGTPPSWPESTRRISQLRLELRYQSRRWSSSLRQTSTLNLDIVDYPGEWLLDLPLLSQSFAEWSAGAIARASLPHAANEAAPFLAALAATDSSAEATDADAERLATAFTQYLRASREDGRALSTLPPGRFLLPGEMEGSPALTFAPLPPPNGGVRHQSLYAMLERRYEAYKALVVRPFFRDHFARLDRQIVLVDTLRALNAGPAAVSDLETALTDILAAFRQGRNNPISKLVVRRIDRILFAATKADHIHSSSHDRLEAVMNRLVAKAGKRARFAGAETRSMAIAAVRATRESIVSDAGERHEVIVGTPERASGSRGRRMTGGPRWRYFPASCPPIPASCSTPGDRWPLNFLRFQPPERLERNAEGQLVLPHVRLDRALEYLIGDRLR